MKLEAEWFQSSKTEVIFYFISPPMSSMCEWAVGGAAAASFADCVVFSSTDRRASTYDATYLVESVVALKGKALEVLAAV